MDKKQDGGPGNQGHDRREFLRCAAWAGAGVVWTVAGGAAASSLLTAEAAPAKSRALSFVQVSDSHIGFAKEPNPDARATLRECVAKIKGLKEKPAFILHTGDVSQLSKDAEFDDAAQILSETGVPVFYVPGEHDVLDEGQGKAFLDRFGKKTPDNKIGGDGWYAFDHSGVHFIGLVNVKELQGGGMGHLGEAQLTWLAADLAKRSASQPIVVFTHIPMWTVYADWGWGTDDSAQALSLLKRFGSVTVLNGHIHQVIEKVEGNVAFHTANSTAFPQPAPGAASSPGPLKVPAGDLRTYLGVREIDVVKGKHELAVIEAKLA
jgi:3',5'-cyclic AMP phosphodiesterase CpdA